MTGIRFAGEWIHLEGAITKAGTTDLMLDAPSRRKTSSPYRRALVHDFDDGLTINWADDYPAGVSINGCRQIAGHPNRDWLIVRSRITQQFGTDFMLDGGTARRGSASTRLNPYRRDEDLDPLEVIREGHRAYMRAYERYAGLMVAFEQAATVDPGFAEMRVARGDLFGRRNARRIQEFQEQGLFNDALDPWLVALALNSMVSRMAYRAIALGNDIDVDHLVDVLTELWGRALGLIDADPQDAD